MGAYDKERLENLICYFSYAYYKNKRRYISQTELYKYIAFFEFRILKQIGKPPLHLHYKAMEHGPVPAELYSDRGKQKSGLYEFINIKDNEYRIKALKNPNLDFFSEYEEEEMCIILDSFKKNNVKSNNASIASHESIRAWKVAYSKDKNSNITFDDEFEFKDKQNLNSQEDVYMLYKSLYNLCK
jgi:uncharacterized phage-associated protein